MSATEGNSPTLVVNWAHQLTLRTGADGLDNGTRCCREAGNVCCTCQDLWGSLSLFSSHTQAEMPRERESPVVLP